MKLSVKRKVYASKPVYVPGTPTGRSATAHIAEHFSEIGEDNNENIS